MHQQGWGFFLGNLERYLTGGEDQRDPALQMRISGAGATTAGP